MDRVYWNEGCGCSGHYPDYVPIEHCNVNKWARITDSWCPKHSLTRFTGTQSKADTTNPKDLVGIKKVSITKLPAVAILHASHAMMFGANLYGSYNWRAKKVQAEIYIDAALRHITSWNEREERAEDSGVHHLGHAIACLSILLDAQETGNLVDDRPVAEGTYQKVLARLNEAISKGAAK